MREPLDIVAIALTHPLHRTLGEFLHPLNHMPHRSPQFLPKANFLLALFRDLLTKFVRRSAGLLHCGRWQHLMESLDRAAPCLTDALHQ